MHRVEGLGMTSRRTKLRMIERLRAKNISRIDVLSAMEHVPRHLFLDEALSHRAYEDSSLPIGHGQTLSQPWVVAKMTELLLDYSNPKRVLEIGTGSGYQTAILAQLVDEIITIERIKPLQDKAAKLLRRLGVRGVRYIHSDGELGYERFAPYDAIISTAAPEVVPLSLKKQLAIGGVLVIPVGGDVQHLTVIIREDENDFREETLDPVFFVPLVGGELIGV